MDGTLGFFPLLWIPSCDNNMENSGGFSEFANETCSDNNLVLYVLRRSGTPRCGHQAARYLLKA